MTDLCTLDIDTELAAGRVTGRLMQAAAEQGRLRPRFGWVLLKAIHEENSLHGESDIMKNARESGAVKLDARDAVAFRILATGEGVVDLIPGDIVQQTSATGDVVDHTDTRCPYWLIHSDDVTGVIR